jgi:transcriptional regulator with XRE-family HTH domain
MSLILGALPIIITFFESLFQVRSCQVSDKTLEDVAKRAGVSRSTVSRVIKDHPNMSENARRHVSKVIQKTVYRPHAAARTLASFNHQSCTCELNLLPPLFTLGVEYLLT